MTLWAQFGVFCIDDTKILRAKQASSLKWNWVSQRKLIGANLMQSNRLNLSTYAHIYIRDRERGRGREIVNKLAQLDDEDAIQVGDSHRSSVSPVSLYHLAPSFRAYLQAVPRDHKRARFWRLIRFAIWIAQISASHFASMEIKEFHSTHDGFWVSYWCFIRL